MKRLHVILLMLMTAVSACYESPVPLGPSDAVPVSTELAGTWNQIDVPGDEDAAQLVVLPFNEYEYYLEFSCDSTTCDDPEVLRLRAFTTLVDGVPFANVQLIEEDQRNYIFFRYELSDGETLSLRGVGGNLLSEKFATPEALYEFVEEHLDQEELYEDDSANFHKVKE